MRLGVAGRDRFQVIPLGLDLEPFATLDPAPGRELRRGLGIGDDEVVLSFVGRVVPIKRVDVLLRALALAKDAGPLRLLVVGDGEIRPRLQKLCRELGTSDLVRFLGYRRDLTTIASAADIAVLTSANEGAGFADRGRRGGRPAMATRVGGVPEVVTPETILVPRTIPRRRRRRCGGWRPTRPASPARGSGA